MKTIESVTAALETINRQIAENEEQQKRISDTRPADAPASPALAELQQVMARLELDRERAQCDLVALKNP